MSKGISILQCILVHNIAKKIMQLYKQLYNKLYKQLYKKADIVLRLQYK